MFIAHYENTMRNARPKFVAPEIIRTVDQARAEKRMAALEEQRQQAAAWAEKMEEAQAKALLAAKAPTLYRILHIRDSIGKTHVRSLIEMVGTFHGVSFEDIVGVRRDRITVAARYDAIAAVRKARPDLSTPQIGKHFNRDHTSVLHALGRLSRASKPSPNDGDSAT